MYVATVLHHTGLLGQKHALASQVQNGDIQELSICHSAKFFRISRVLTGKIYVSFFGCSS